MNIPPHLLKNQFIGLPPERKEAAFALSCYDLGDWEEGFDWLSNPESVRKEIDKFLQDLLPESVWTKISADKQDRQKAEDLFLTGEISNHFLAWYCESEFDRVGGHTESQSTRSQYDVRLSVDGVDTVGIEIKRVANSSQLTNYLEDFPSKVNRRTNVSYKLLIIYYPVEEGVGNRAASLVSGYGWLSPRVHDFYQNSDVFVANIPAPYPRDQGEIRPLKETKNLLQQRTDF